jgi:hypothetical protein
MSLPWLPKIRAQGCPAAICAQEGMTLDNIPWDEFDCLFIGGNNEFKEGELVRAACKEAKRRGKWTHMGRVNTERRMILAQCFNVDSVDGTYLLHEEAKGRASEGVDDIVEWLRTLHKRRRANVKRVLAKHGLDEEQIKTYLDNSM